MLSKFVIRQWLYIIYNDIQKLRETEQFGKH